LDGTISDPLEGIGRSINYALSHFGYAELDVKALAIYVGPPIDQTFAHITGIQSPTEIAAFVAKYRERYGDVGYSENLLYTGIVEALQDLCAAGVPLAVCTSKRVDFAERILEMFGLRHYFRFVNGGEVGIQKWQQLADLKSQGLVTGSSVMVGDRAVDIIAANRNGLSACAVLWGHGSRAELVAEKPYYLFASPNELPVLV